jgi:hypothetical protein
MNARIALPLLTLVTALSSLPPVECKAASMSMSGGIAGDVTVASSSDFLYGNGQHADKSGKPQPIHPQLKPDYACQNLHVREPTCPPR